MTIPVIDIFAGPGGLGEGFSSYLSNDGKPIFKIKLSIEMDDFAHRTLELRAFFRQFQDGKTPSEYYDYLKKKINRDELFEKYPQQASTAKREAWKATLGRTDKIRQIPYFRGSQWGNQLGLNRRSSLSGIFPSWAFQNAR